MGRKERLAAGKVVAGDALGISRHSHEHTVLPELEGERPQSGQGFALLIEQLVAGDPVPAPFGLGGVGGVDLFHIGILGEKPAVEPDPVGSLQPVAHHAVFHVGKAVAGENQISEGLCTFTLRGRGAGLVPGDKAEAAGEQIVPRASGKFALVRVQLHGGAVCGKGQAQFFQTLQGKAETVPQIRQRENAVFIFGLLQIGGVDLFVVVGVAGEKPAVELQPLRGLQPVFDAALLRHGPAVHGGERLLQRPAGQRRGRGGDSGGRQRRFNCGCGGRRGRRDGRCQSICRRRAAGREQQGGQQQNKNAFIHDETSPHNARFSTYKTILRGKSSESNAMRGKQSGGRAPGG